MTERTIRNWRRRADTERRPAGRPKADPEVAAAKAAAARVAIEAVRAEIGRTAGEPAVLRALAARLAPSDVPPRRLVRTLLAELKAAERRATSERIEGLRTTVIVHAKDAMWSEDALHVGVAEGAVAAPVKAEVVRDVGACLLLGVDAGPPSTAGGVIATILRALCVAGTFPLVFVSDNGQPYPSEELEAFLREHKIVHLRNVPRTPQHNAWAERGVRELKEESGLAWRPAVFRVRALGEAARRLNRRPRASRKLLTALELRRSMPAATTFVDRETFYAAACAAVERAMQGVTGARARRRAEREAIFEVMERFGLITRYRGGVAKTHGPAETIR